jgi:hypothetical protein
LQVHVDKVAARAGEVLGSRLVNLHGMVSRHIKGDFMDCGLAEGLCLDAQKLLHVVAPGTDDSPLGLVLGLAALQAAAPAAGAPRTGSPAFRDCTVRFKAKAECLKNPEMAPAAVFVKAGLTMAFLNEVVTAGESVLSAAQKGDGSAALRLTEGVAVGAAMLEEYDVLVAKDDDEEFIKVMRSKAGKGRLSAANVVALQQALDSDVAKAPSSRLGCMRRHFLSDGRDATRGALLGRPRTPQVHDGALATCMQKHSFSERFSRHSASLAAVGGRRIQAGAEAASDVERAMGLIRGLKEMVQRYAIVALLRNPAILSDCGSGKKFRKDLIEVVAGMKASESGLLGDERLMSRIQAVHDQTAPKKRSAGAVAAAASAAAEKPQLGNQRKRSRK